MSTFFVKLSNNALYQKIMKEPITYVTGAVLLAVFQIAHIILLQKGWGITSTFADWGAWIYERLGGSVRHWEYFSSAKSQTMLDGSLLDNGGSIRNIGIIVGALIATLFASEFKLKKIKTLRQILAAILGGFLMGYGARLANGCNIGALFTAISGFSLSGWVFAFFLFIGAFLGSKLLIRFFI